MLISRTFSGKSHSSPIIHRFLPSIHRAATGFVVMLNSWEICS
jgi:hypothetical protein